MPAPAHPFDPIARPDGPPGAAHAAASVPVYDPATLIELEAVFGHARLMDLLAHLKVEIAERLRAPETDRPALRHDAHTLLSVSGSLGFFDLSRCCVEMERACLLDADLAAPLSAARVAAANAIAAIGRLEAGATQVRPADGATQVCAA